MTAIVANSGSALSISLVVSILAALWSASGGVGNIVTAINVAYDEEETRGFVKRKALALGLTFGGVLFAVVAVTLATAYEVVTGASSAMPSRSSVTIPPRRCSKDETPAP
mgnify:CR=1 FL=1